MTEEINKKFYEKGKRKRRTKTLAEILAIGAFTGCGSSGSDTKDTKEAKSTQEDSKEEDTKAGDKGTITVAASATPHAEILEQAKKILADEGWDLEIKVFSDYVQPNLVVESGEFDANYFQHIPYLESFNKEQGTQNDLSKVEKGDVIAVPNDTTNEARALLLLQDNGLIKLKDGVGLEATVNDIAENPKGIEITELEAAQVPHAVDDAAFVVLNGNYALEAGYTVAKDALAYEKSDSEAAKTYVNIIAVKEGNEDNEGIKELVKVLKSDDIKKYINDTYDGAVIPFEE